MENEVFDWLSEILAKQRAEQHKILNQLHDYDDKRKDDHANGRRTN